MSSYDISLGGADYIVLPGGYRASAGDGGGRRIETQRISPVDGVLASVACRPSQHGGLLPVPAAQPIAGSIDGSKPLLASADGTHLFFVNGTTLYRWDRVLANAPVARATLPASATCLTRVNGLLFVGFGSAADVVSWDDATGTLVMSALGAGVRASLLGSFSRAVVLVGPTAPVNLHLYFGSSLSYRRTWKLDGPIRTFTSFDDGMVVATDAGLHRLSGDWYQEADPPAPDDTLRLGAWGTLAGQLQSADDFAWLTIYQGRLIAWLGRQVVWFDAARGWWTPAGLRGAATTGAAIVNGLLLTTINPTSNPSASQLWSYDGDGWWLLAEAAVGSTLTTPFGDGDGKLVTVDRVTNTLAARDLATGTPTVDAFSVTVEAPSAGEPTRWRSLAVELLRLDGITVGDWQLEIAISTDAGLTWSSVGSPASVTTNVAIVERLIDQTTPSLLVRVAGQRISGAAPAIHGIRIMSELGGERRWRLRLRGRDRAIDRAGQADPRDPASVRAALWTLWNDGGTTTLVDIDGTSRSVRLTALREETPRPADHHPTSTFEIDLVEV